MKNLTRRNLVLCSTLGLAALGPVTARAQSAGMLSESDATATALGYREDTTKVEAVKFPKHTVVQRCGTCALFQGSITATSGPCPLFAGKQVAGAGWCSAYSARAS